MLLIGNGRLITRNENNSFYENGAVLVEGNVIKDVGPFEEMKSKYPEAEFVDAKGNVIMPGMINAHSHIYSAMARGMFLNNPPHRGFLDILANQWWRMDKGLTLEDTKYSAYVTLIDSVKYGVTTIFDHHAAPFSATDGLFTVADVAKEVGIRANLAYEVSDRDGEEVMKNGVKENIDFMKHYNTNDQDTIRGMFGMHASFTLSDKTMEYCASEMAGNNAGYHIHVAEGIEDLNACLKDHGKRLAYRLDDYGILQPNTLAIHGIYLNKNEMELIKERDVTMVHNPESNMGNAVGTSPVIKMMELGIRVGLGTDSYTDDMFESMKVANIIHKDHLCDPNVAWGEVPQMQFVHNKEIVKRHFGIDVGALQEGYKADIIIVEYDPRTPMTENNINSHILFGFMGKSVTDTFIDGKHIVKDRVITTVDETAINAKTRELTADFWTRI